MTLETAVISSVVARLSALPALSGVQILASNADQEEAVPRVVVDALRTGPAVPGYAIYDVRTDFEITANAWAGANSLDSLSGNSEVESIFSAITEAMAGDPTALSDSEVTVVGCRWDGGVGESRDGRKITRNWSVTLVAAPMTLS